MRSGNVYHDFDGEAGLGELGTSVGDVLSSVVGALGTTAEDDVHIGVALGLDDRGETLLADGEEARVLEDDRRAEVLEASLRPDVPL